MGRVLSLAAAKPILATARAQGKKVVLTNGCFDLLHLGHVRYLKEAKALGDLLVVGINSDASVRGFKDPRRPLVPLAERAEVLAALECVDYVIPFEEPTAVALVEALRPEVYVKGGDYAPGGAGKPLPEAEVVASYGGEVRLLPLVPGLSTTALIERIARLYGTP